MPADITTIREQVRRRLAEVEAQLEAVRRETAQLTAIAATFDETSAAAPRAAEDPGDRRQPPGDAAGGQALASLADLPGPGVPTRHGSAANRRSPPPAPDAAARLIALLLALRTRSRPDAAEALRALTGREDAAAILGRMHG